MRNADTDHNPRIEDRDEQPYVGIRDVVTLDGEADAIPKHLSRLQSWMLNRGVEPTGPPFVRYVVVDMPWMLEIHVAFPVAEGVDGDDVVRSHRLPAGSYAVFTHSGPHESLIDANVTLQAWGEQQRLVWATQLADRGTAWDARTETYLTDPSTGPEEQQTEIAYLTRGDPAM